MISKTLNVQSTVEQTETQRKVGTHWSINQTPHLFHFKFKLSPLNDPQWSRHFVDPAFRLMRFPLDGELDFYF